MDLLNKLERKYGRYAIRNLPVIIIAAYVTGYVFQIFSPQILSMFYLEPRLILQGQIWRLFTWVFIGPPLHILTFITMLFFYYVGTAMEHTWGTFRFNLFLLSGIIVNIIGAFIYYFFIGNGEDMYALFTTYYLMESLFLAFALHYPDMPFYLYFMVPIRAKWIALIDLISIGLEFMDGSVGDRFSILISMIPFLVLMAFSMKTIVRRNKRARDYRKKVQYGERQRYAGAEKAAQNAPQKAKPMVTRHKCAVCGKTENDDPNMVFRFCSKCNGNYEYCQDHLFTHQHVGNDQSNV